MNHNLSFNITDPYVGNDYWIAHLSDGSSVFEDKTPNIDSAWQRLFKYIQETDFSIVYLQMVYCDTHVTTPPGQEGYFQSKIYSALMLPENPIEIISHGIGYLKDGNINIQWVYPNQGIADEVRPYIFKENSKEIIFSKKSCKK